ncbi:hypothetical protein M0802_014645 [Mischocyttarus mexicanus]|nr:hypothetical protein M0802_014645 [Mischocyttarus mexicanus]
MAGSPIPLQSPPSHNPPVRLLPSHLSPLIPVLWFEVNNQHHNTTTITTIANGTHHYQREMGETQWQYLVKACARIFILQELGWGFTTYRLVSVVMRTYTRIAVTAIPTVYYSTVSATCHLVGNKKA